MSRILRKSISRSVMNGLSGLFVQVYYSLSTVIGCRYIIKKLKFNYAGHVARGEEGRWERKVMEWYPSEGRRKPEKPATRWESEIIKHARILWGRDARVRNRCRRVGDGQ